VVLRVQFCILASCWLFESNGVKATKRKKSWKSKRCTANRKCSENGEVIEWCTVGRSERERGCKGRVR